MTTEQQEYEQRLEERQLREERTRQERQREQEQLEQQQFEDQLAEESEAQQMEALIFSVGRGAPCKVGSPYIELFPAALVGHTTMNDNAFMPEDIVVDPTGQFPRKQLGKSEYGDELAAKGYYVFSRAGWLLLVHKNNVQIW